MGAGKGGMTGARRSTAVLFACVAAVLMSPVAAIDFDLYSVLGVEKDASSADIMSAFVDLSASHHPEANLREFKKANRLYEEMKLAFEVLYDKDKRKAYDSKGKSVVTDAEFDHRVEETNNDYMSGKKGGNCPPCKKQPSSCPAAPKCPACPSGGGAAAVSRGDDDDEDEQDAHPRGAIPQGVLPNLAKSGKGGKASEKAPAAGGKKARKASKKSPVNRKSLSEEEKQKKTTEDFYEIQDGIRIMNAGRFELALDELNAVLLRNPFNLPGLVSKGTALALTGRLAESVEFFTKAIEVDDTVSETYLRRAQALGGQEKNLEAAYDYQVVMEKDPDNAAAIYEYCVTLHKLKDYRTCVPLINRGTELRPDEYRFWNLRGLCHIGMGLAFDALDFYNKAREVDPHVGEPVVNLAQTFKGVGDVASSEIWWRKVLQLEPWKYDHYRFIAEMYQRTGQHILVIQYGLEALARGCEEKASNCLMMVAQAYASQGYYEPAIHYFSKVLEIPAVDMGTAEIAYTSFYGIEHALYMLRHLDRDVRTFSMDRELDPRFLKGWAKKMNPLEIFTGLKRQPQPTREELDAPPPPKPDAGDAAQLLKVAKALGRLTQNNCTGFHPHLRQQVGGGLAAVELAQSIKQLIKLRREGKDWIVKGEGASSATNEPVEDHPFAWRDAMDIVVRWRAIVAPDEQVCWVDMLTDDVFEAGFGSHTPIFKGQGRDIRYYMNFDVAFALFKKLVMDNKGVHDMTKPLGSPIKTFDDEKLEAINNTTHCVDIVKELDTPGSFVIVPIKSEREPGHTLVGTQLVMTNMNTGRPPWAYEHELCIHTPTDPPRFRSYDQEFEYVFDDFMALMIAGDKIKAAQRALHFAYYWYNLMPLARGSAMVGHVTLMGLLLAADAPITNYIPPKTQVDWAAILCEDPKDFAANVGSWMLPEEMRPGSGTRGHEKEQDLVVHDVNISQLKNEVFEALPDVAETFKTFRSRIEAMNDAVAGYEMPRIVNGGLDPLGLEARDEKPALAP